ncbi:MAG: hypothetical protein GWN99_10705 [Gemmatimonadetes bacterium]|uniref:Uncharacterized protein n=1 Tax=Candidatus Kutchimonas denitrificans TaxID=3056748 RepID=A0AAE4Z9S4_9BACT|nr:hypothetical protein [Gemmatimonadota bacterium]NIR74766.1 hypothetical protein [Candidatus Kutchimonas denitrificans]NIS01516.1 hypothetical protein [Gemmatimonadota bacterium]NIT67257.1 hypothetical protein [Gemmatimonadota bacterium]NIU52431.1 hypothetical protein [Gemmatimonadota bacterium]
MARLGSWRTGVAFLGVTLAWCSWSATELFAQQWRARVSTRVQYIEARALVRDSALESTVGGTGTQRTKGDTIVTCTSGETYCFFYRSGEVANSSPAVVDVDLNVFGFGIEGLRGYVSTRFRNDFSDATFGNDEFWPRGDEHFDLLAGYVELNRRSFRARVGRDYQVSGLGYYGYDGGSFLYRYRPWNVEVEAYGGWGLARGVPISITSDEFGSLGVFQPPERDYLFGFRGSVRPTANSSIEAIYQREIPTDRDGITSERVAIEAAWYPRRELSLLAHTDFDLATGLWGKAGLNVGYWANDKIYLQGRLFRYRPVFSLQTIWVAFSPVPYTGWNLSVGVEPRSDVSLRLWGERRSYSDTEAEIGFFATTDRDWRVGGSVGWRPNAFNRVWDVSGNYWLNWGFGSAVSSGDLRIGVSPRDRLSVGLRLSASQQLGEFRVGEGRIWAIGGDARWRTPAGTIWASVDRYRHDRRIDGDIEDDPSQPDWTQWRLAFGLSYYLGSEPGRVP